MGQEVLQEDDFDQIKTLEIYQHVLILTRHIFFRLETYQYAHNYGGLIVYILKLIHHFQRSFKLKKQKFNRPLHSWPNVLIAESLRYYPS